MCLISIKDKNVPLQKEFFKSIARSYSLRNKDGAGYALLRNGAKEVVFKKGFFRLNDLIKSIKEEKVQLEDILVVHLRKVSAGKKIAVNMHPFVMSHKEEELMLTGGTTKKGVLFHNGTFSSFNNFNSIFSDTYHFVRLFAGYKFFTEWIKDLCKSPKSLDKINIGVSNRIVILHPRKGLVVAHKSNFYEDMNGYIYSNLTFTKAATKQAQLNMTDVYTEKYNGYANNHSHSPAQWKGGKHRHSYFNYATNKWEDHSDGFAD